MSQTSKTRERIEKSDAEWRRQLSPEEYRVTRKHGTERAFTGRYWDEKRDGLYRCVCCGEPLFSSDSKYDSGTGWPSYSQPLSPDAVETQKDRTLWMVRTEVHCARCEAHLGHVFEDGPAPSGLRYCLNSAALTFQPAGQPAGEDGKAEDGETGRTDGDGPD